jgi:uncharacterized SAM-binding protein YcdF (DUF218 family)
MVSKRTGILQCWKKRLHRWQPLIWALGGAMLLVIWSFIPLRLAIAFYQAPTPQAILVLGGGSDREFFAAQFAQQSPHLDVWVSSGTPPAYARSLFQQAGISADRVHLDRRATDTVTNFTTLVPDFKQRHLQHVYVITSDFHMPRALAIAMLVFGSQGIAVTPSPLLPGHPDANPGNGRYATVADRFCGC